MTANTACPPYSAGSRPPTHGPAKWPRFVSESDIAKRIQDDARLQTDERRSALSPAGQRQLRGYNGAGEASEVEAAQQDIQSDCEQQVDDAGNNKQQPACRQAEHGTRSEIADQRAADKSAECPRQRADADGQADCRRGYIAFEGEQQCEQRHAHRTANAGEHGVDQQRVDDGMKLLKLCKPIAQDDSPLSGAVCAVV